MRLNTSQTNQIITVGATEINLANNPLSSQPSYTCANREITRGVTKAPYTLHECYMRFPKIRMMGEAMGVCAGKILDNDYYPSKYWRGPTGISGGEIFYDLLLGITSSECEKILGMTYGGGFDVDGNELPTEPPLGTAWMGCLWGSPMASFSCTCPDVGERFEDYLKLRLNVATFWNTPIEVPPQRQEFLDSVQYGERATMTVAGNFNIQPGHIVRIKVDNMTSMSNGNGGSILTKEYYVLSVSHTAYNGGVHETLLEICDIRKNDVVVI